MHSPGTPFPCLPPMLGRGQGPRGSAPPPSALGAQGRMPDTEGSDTRHTAVQNTPQRVPCAPIWEERGAKTYKEKEGSGAVCPLLVRVDPQPPCHRHSPKTEHRRHSRNASEWVNMGKDSKNHWVKGVTQD